MHSKIRFVSSVFQGLVEMSTRPKALTRTQEPRFDHVRQLGRRTFPQQELFRMVPSHSAEWGTASDEDDFALVGFECWSHDDRKLIMVFCDVDESSVVGRRWLKL